MRSRVTVVLVVASLAGLAVAAPLSAAPGVGVKVSQPLPQTGTYCDVPVTATWKPIAGQASVQLHVVDLTFDVGPDLAATDAVEPTQGSWDVTSGFPLVWLTDGSRHRFAFTVSVRDAGGFVLRSGTNQVW